MRPGATTECDCGDHRGVAVCSAAGRYGTCDCDQPAEADAGGELDAGNVESCTPSAWYPDVDGDGFGDQQAMPTMACIPPGGYVANNDDCADADERANPMQQLPQEGPVNGVGGGDYNCDGAAVPVDAPIRSCSAPCGSANGWLGSAPACGTTGTWLVFCGASGNPNVCQAPQTEARPQKCL